MWLACELLARKAQLEATVTVRDFDLIFEAPTVNVTA